MDRANSVKQLRQQVAVWRAAGESIALVPTMGNLHAGHLGILNWSNRHSSELIG